MENQTPAQTPQPEQEQATSETPQKRSFSLANLPGLEAVKNNPLVFVLLGLVVFLLIIILVGGWWFLLRSKPSGKPADTVQKKQEQITSTAQVEPAPQTILQTVGTEFKGVTANLTSIQRSGNVVTVRFFLKAADDKSELDSDCVTRATRIVAKDNSEGFKCLNGIGKDDPYSLETASLIDEANQIKYEVLRDATGACLCTTGLKQLLNSGQTVSLYAQFNAPPGGVSSITINFPKIQPFTGIQL